MSDYGEIFCEAVEEIVRNELRGLNFDLTRVCQVDNVDERDKGIYIVSTDSARFKAYSSDTTYDVGDTVYVVTPNNDNTQQKIIIAKKVIESPQDITYVMPFNNMTDITKNLVKGNRENSLLANGVIGNSEAKNAQPIWDYNNALVGYTRLGVQGSFRSSVPDAVEGSYGLKIELYVKGKNEESRIIATLFLDSDDMYGNPYNFDGYYIQQKVFDISSIPAFDEIKVYFYQDSDFKNSQGELIAHLDSFGCNLNHNLFVNDLYICLGYDVDDIYNNGLILYSRDGYLYDANGGERRIEWRFLYTGKDKKTTLITEPEKLPYGYSIRLYKYNVDAMYNSIAGADWEEVEDENKKDEEDKALKDFTIHTFKTVGTKEFDKFKAIIIYRNRALYESNILEFTNTADLVYTKLNKLQGSFQIRTSGDYDGVYNVYDDNNNIITAKTTQYLYPMFQDDDGVYTTIDNIEKIKWTIPKTNSMIDLAINPAYIYKIEDESLGDDKSENAITQYIESLDPLEFNYYTYGDYYYAYFLKPKNDQARIPFKLKEVLNVSNSNNTIICNLKHADLELKAMKDLKFGYKSIEDYRAVLKFEDRSIDGFLLSDSQDGTKRKVILKFYDPEGSEVSVENYTVETSWYREDDDGPEGGTKIIQLFDAISEDKNTYNLKFKNKYSSMNDIPENGYYNVFKVVVTYKGYNYTALLPISISAPDDDTQEIETEGVSNIVYNEDGASKNNMQKATASYKDRSNKLNEAFLSFMSSYDTSALEDKYKPNYNNETKQVEPLATAPQNLKAIYAAIVRKDETKPPIKIQPVIPIIEKLVSRIPEKSIQIGNSLSRAANETYQIKSANFSAGKLEDTTQKYTGIVMGKVKKNNEDEKYGLYGFKDDQLTFSVNQEGKAYFKGTVEAEGGVFNGTLNAESGHIGSWHINNGALTDATNSISLEPVTGDNGLPAINIGGLIINAGTILGENAVINGVDISDSLIQLSKVDGNLQNYIDKLNKEIFSSDNTGNANSLIDPNWGTITYLESYTTETAKIKDINDKEIEVITKIIPIYKTINILTY